MALTKPGKIVIISSPSGGGKTSICRRLLTPYSRSNGWVFSVSYTTRSKRPGERNGREYFFVSEEKFSKLAKRNFFAEQFRVHQNRYGTPRGLLERVRKRGGVAILDIDIQGACRLVKEYPEAISIFILPPTIKELKRRLKDRGTETKEQLVVRYEGAIREIKAARTGGVDYVVENKDIITAVNEVRKIIEADHLRVDKAGGELLRKIIR